MLIADLGASSIDITRISSLDRDAMHAERPPFKCPGCRGLVHLLRISTEPPSDREFYKDGLGPFMVFRHHAGYGAACKAVGYDESPAHDLLKQRLARGARRAGWDAELEVVGGSCRADVVVSRRGMKTRVLEAQLAKLERGDVLRRTELYKTEFGDPIWFHTGRRQWRTEVPALEVDRESQEIIVGGVYLDQGGHDPAPSMSVVVAVPQALNDKLRWLGLPGQDGYFIDVAAAYTSRPRTPPKKARTDAAFSGRYVQAQCERVPVTVAEAKPQAPATVVTLLGHDLHGHRVEHSSSLGTTHHYHRADGVAIYGDPWLCGGRDIWCGDDHHDGLGH